jgi:ribosomal protein S18 acetylase RimI-like enzyme
MELDDLPAVFELGERLFTADRWPTLYRTWDQYEVVELFASDGETCIVAEDDDGRVVGFALGTLIEKRRSAWTYGYLLWIGVDPTAGRRGTGARLVKRLTDLFIEQGARMMLVDTDAENAEALAFFRSLGFGNESQHVYLQRNLSTHPGYIRKRRKHTSTARARGTSSPTTAPTHVSPDVDEPQENEP